VLAHDILRQYLQHTFPDAKIERLLSPYFRDSTGRLVKMTPLFYRESCIGYHAFYNNILYYFETPELIKLESSLQ
jgi:hypothetical protein